jgi:hypothetical protein
MERNVLDWSVSEMIGHTLIRTSFIIAAALINAWTPWYIGRPTVAALVVYSVVSAWAMRTGRCQYCGARGGLPVPRNTAIGPVVRDWYDPRPMDRRGVTWVCPGHFNSYLDERL